MVISDLLDTRTHEVNRTLEDPHSVLQLARRLLCSLLAWGHVYCWSATGIITEQKLHARDCLGFD